MIRLFAQHARWRSLTLIGSETALLLGAVIISVYWTLGAQSMASAHAQAMLGKTLLIVAVCQICFYCGDLYELKLVNDLYELFVRVLHSLAATAVILAVAYTWFPDLVIGPGVSAIAATLAVVLITSWRVVFGWVMTRIAPRERLLVVGRTQASMALAREIDELQQLGVEIVGFVDVDGQTADPAAGQLLGTIEDIPAIVRARSVQRVVVSLADARGTLPMEKLLEMKLDGVSFDHLASVYERYTGKIAVENLRPSWLIFSPGFQKTSLLKSGKRLFDVAAGAIGFLALAPVMLLIALAVKLTSPGPAVYRQDRVGQDGRIFSLMKFRSMRDDAEAGTGAVWACQRDARVTSVGRFLRRARLDELPQLWNILIGDMSLVGPRPERPEFVKDLTREIPFYGQRHVVKPGLTGWAQTCYPYASSIEETMQKLQYDLFYIKNMSIALDLFIVLKTVKIVALGGGS
jgi:sugar transferase (PEP-CTERM system associated)